MKKKKHDLTFGEIVEVFIPKLWIVVICAIALAGLMALYSLLIKPDTYTATTSIIVYNEASEKDTSNSDITAAQNMVATYSYIIKSDFFLESIINGSEEKGIEPLPAEYGFTPAKLRSYISTEQEGSTEIFTVKVTAKDPTEAQLVADAIYNYCSILLPEKTPYTITVKTIDAPKLPTANSKGVVSSAIIGALVAVVVSMICIWIYNVLDIVIRDRKKIEDNFDIPILGVIPAFDVNTEENSDEKE